MDFIPSGYINIRNALDRILRATHGDDWGQQEIGLEKDKVRVAGAFDENEQPIEGQPYDRKAIARARQQVNVYGERAPTPDELRQDESVEWQRVEVFAAGRLHWFRVKTLAPLRWRVAGGDRDLRLIVIAPLAYRPRPGSRLLYRKPAYLIVTDPTLELQQALRQYVWRWEIEVNFRDQKTLLGVGQAQVRQPDSVERVPQFQTAAYALLLLAGARWSRRHGAPAALPQPHWQRHRQPQRVTTSRLIQHLRADLWADGLSAQSFCGFATAPPADQKPQKLPGALLAAAIFASG